MLEFKADAFFEATRLMQHTLTAIQVSKSKSVKEHPDGSVTVELITDAVLIRVLKGRNSDLRASLEVLGARITLMALRELDAKLSGDTTYESITKGYEDVASTLRRELTETKLLVLNREERLWYDPLKPPFGSMFDLRFTTHGAFELDEACKCLGLGRPTAAVFHLMRLLEVGIRAIAASLGIPDPVKPAERNWAIVLKKIRDGIDAKWPGTAQRMSGDGQLFDALYASLDAVKNPFRNATMHVENKYTEAEAQHIFAMVKGLMMKLSDRMDEDGVLQ
jgi:hypothetical protein